MHLRYVHITNMKKYLAAHYSIHCTICGNFIIAIFIHGLLIQYSVTMRPEPFFWKHRALLIYKSRLSYKKVLIQNLYLFLHSARPKSQTPISQMNVLAPTP